VKNKFVSINNCRYICAIINCTKQKSNGFDLRNTRLDDIHICLRVDNQNKIIMLLTITDVEYISDYTLLCTFSTGERRKVDLTPLLAYPAFGELRDKQKFIQFGLEDTIFWANGADIAPEYLYERGVAA